MTSYVSVSAACANVVVFVALAAAVVSPRLSRLARTMFSTFAFVCAWLITALFDAMRSPDWAVLMGAALIAVSIVVVIATLHRWTQAGDGGGTPPAGRRDEGGGGPRRHGPDPPKTGGGDSDRSWWPEFERRLSLYVAEREGKDRPPVVLRSSPLRVSSDRGGDRRRRPCSQTIAFAPSGQTKLIVADHGASHLVRWTAIRGHDANAETNVLTSATRLLVDAMLAEANAAGEKQRLAGDCIPA